MRSVSSLTLASVLACAASAAAAQSCTAAPFYSLPAYGIKSGCIPTSYNSAGDLGQTNPTDAATRCSQQCSNAPNCGGWAAQLNKAADSGLYSGTCFLYTTLPATPRECVDKPSELVAGVRDDTPKCFSTSSAAATAFCSSFLGIGVKTVTVTAAAPTTTSTTVVQQLLSLTSTTVLPVTTTVSTTTSTTSTETTVVVTTTVTTTTVTAAAIQPVTKRAVAQPACVPSNVPASQLSANCKCLSIAPKTVTSTFTPAAVVVPATSTSTFTTLVALTQTTLTTLTVPATTIIKETVTSLTTTVQVTTATAPAACVPTYPAGNVIVNPGFNDGTYTGWNPGGYKGFSYSISDDAQCGAYGARFTITDSGSYARIGQRFQGTLDATKTYRIRTYAKLASGDGTNCFYYLSCQRPNDFSSAGNPRLDTPLTTIPSTWTEYSLTCPVSNTLTMSITIQCNQGTGPVTIGMDEITMTPV